MKRFLIAANGRVRVAPVAASGFHWRQCVYLFRDGLELARAVARKSSVQRDCQSPALAKRNAAVAELARPGDTLIVTYEGTFNDVTQYIVASPMGKRRVKRGYCPPMYVDPLVEQSESRPLRAKWLREDRAVKAARDAELKARLATKRAVLRAAAKKRH